MEQREGTSLTCADEITQVGTVVTDEAGVFTYALVDDSDQPWESGGERFTLDGAMVRVVATSAFGACGIPGCTDCRPLFDADNDPIPGT